MFDRFFKKTNNSLKFASIPFGALIIAATSLTIFPNKAEANEAACFNFVQNNIPWNYGGSTKWASGNVKNLCKGTSKAAEPGRCFDRVMHGNISYGSGNRWQWKNALNLCQGTNNANATISCFSGKIASGLAWPAAINACKKVPIIITIGTSAAENACFSFVQNNIPWNYGGSTRWASGNVKNLCKGTTKSAEPGRCFDRIMHGNISYGTGSKWKWQNALKLCKGTSNANATISCFSGKISSGQPWPAAINSCKAS